MTTWRVAYIGVENDDGKVAGLNVWKQEWRTIPVPPVDLPHPQYPNQIHSYSVCEMGDPANPIRFAVAELSAMVYGFYVPA